jgi:hypothetical protein
MHLAQVTKYRGPRDMEILDKICFQKISSDDFDAANLATRSSDNFLFLWSLNLTVAKDSLLGSVLVGSHTFT